MAAVNHGIKRIPWWLREPPMERVKAAVDRTPYVAPFMRVRELDKLPKHYQKAFWKQQIDKQQPVHYIPLTKAEQFRYDRVTGVAEHIKSDVPIEGMFPVEADYGLWGGEGVVKGFFRKQKKLVFRRPHWWWPSFQQAVFYSEILDRHMQIVVTDGAYELIEKAGGLDHYILATTPVDLKSRLGMRLKREMLLALARKLPVYADDQEKQQTFMKRYAKYIVPEEVAEWTGLSLVAAVNKYEEAVYTQPMPMKEVFRERVLLELKAERDGIESLPEIAQTVLAETIPAALIALSQAPEATADTAAPAADQTKKPWWKKLTRTDSK